MSRQENPDFDRLLDSATAQIENTQPDPAVAEEAAARVWNRLANAGHSATRAAEVEQIDGCDDYQKLIPAYLDGELGDARRLLLEDHTRSCVPCRRALKSLREGKPLAVSPPVQSTRPRRIDAKRTAPRFSRWAMAAALIAGLGVSLLLTHELDPFGNPDSATVASLDGDLFRLSSASHQPLAVGDVVREGQSIRTGREGGAVVELEDGSLVEMRARSEISIDESRRGTTIQLERGNVIVQAAKQRDRHLYVSTDDCLVSVTGTIFSVNHGTKGSRVSVVEGEVKVSYDGDEATLVPGDQVVTQNNLVTVPVADEIAWSRDVDHYLDLLEELTDLKRTLLQDVPRPGLRYASRLLDLMPDETVVYTALPNLGETVSETHRLLQERLANSPELAEWWAQQGQAGFQPMVEEVVGRLAELGDYLGSELVIGARLDAEAEIDGPLVLAELADPAGMLDFIERQLADAGEQMGEGFDGELIFVDDPFAAPSAGDDTILIWVHEDLLVGSGDGALLAQVASLVLEGTTNPFIGSPLYQDIASLYQDGVELMVAVDLATILAATHDGGSEEAVSFEAVGIDNVRHLLAEQKRSPTHTNHRLTVGFDGDRHGIASWIAEPAPMGSLDFVSPEAKAVVAAVFKDPVAMLDDLAALQGEDDDGLSQVFELFRDRHGLDLRDDLASAFGGEVAFAIDGPLLPSPAWKLVLEVYDPATFQWAVEQGLAELNTDLRQRGEEPIVLEHDESGGRTFYRLPFEAMELHYTFVEGYLVATPSRALLDRALRFRESGYSIVDAPRFTALLPDDGRNNFSVVVYQDLGSTLGAIAERIAGEALNEEQQQRVEALEAETSPLLGYAYADTDRITVAAMSAGDTFSSLLLRVFGVKDPTSLDQIIPELLGEGFEI